MKNIILIAQPRSGGTLAIKVLADLYQKQSLYECFNTHGYGYDTSKYASEIDYKLDKIEYLKSNTNNIVKASWFDLKDVANEISQLDADWFHLERQNPAEMLCSSYLSYITGIFHETKNENFNPARDVVIPMDYVDDFFSKHNCGGWYYNLSKNIELLTDKIYTQLYYDDNTTEQDLLKQVNHDVNNYQYKSDIIKLYPDKTKVILNYDDVEARIREILSNRY